MLGQTKYYWRVKAINTAGESNFSQVNSFTTGFPTLPLLLDPPHTTLDISISPTLIWSKSQSAESYRIQYTKITKIFNDQTILFDSSGISDTTT